MSGKFTWDLACKVLSFGVLVLNGLMMVASSKRDDEKRREELEKFAEEYFRNKGS